MKKFFYTLALCVCITACDAVTQDDKSAKDTASQERQAILMGGQNHLHSDSAKKWIKGIKHMKLKDDSVAWTEYSVADLRSILCDTSMGISRVRFFLSAYDTTFGPGNKRRLVPRIIMQLQSNKVGAQAQYEYNYFTGKTVCPPPEPCLDIED